MNKEAISLSFEDVRNITVGNIRIIWARACRPYITGKDVLDGWALPGGKRTTDRAEALAYAKMLAAL